MDTALPPFRDGELPPLHRHHADGRTDGRMGRRSYVVVLVLVSLLSPVVRSFFADVASAAVDLANNERTNERRRRRRRLAFCGLLVARATVRHQVAQRSIVLCVREKALSSASATSRQPPFDQLQSGA
ncbi:unnamed protein product [Soboliphyme baturini]|uniref:Secreted protein n=1 Tax=Soboliphyme baturini TaxID=241478 RepID=A0A183IZD3_9BILA|nr:unnamed protein product [Soboliphyme baturini]